MKAVGDLSCKPECERGRLERASSGDLQCDHTQKIRLTELEGLD